MPQVRGLSTYRVRRVSLLQRHEEVWWAWKDEAVLHYEAVHRSKCPVVAMALLRHLDKPCSGGLCQSVPTHLSEVLLSLVTRHGL